MRYHTESLTSLLLAYAALACPAALGDYTFPAFSITVDAAETRLPLDGSGAVGDTYASYLLTIEWSSTNGWSSEARAGLADPSVWTPFTSIVSSPDAEDTTTSGLLTWTGNFSHTYVGGQPLEFVARQTFQGSTAQWDNVTLTLVSGVVPPAPPPPALNLGTVGPAWINAYATLNPGGVVWFRFDTPTILAASCDVLRFDLRESTFTGGIYRSGDDSEVGLYSPDGLLLATADDFDAFGGMLHPVLAFGANEATVVESRGDLPAGEYYLAVAGFDAVFGLGGFDVTPDPDTFGTIALKIRHGEPAADCNNNASPDVCDIASGGSADVNTNGVPDECEDCNANTLFDANEIAAGSALDCNANGVLDTCELDAGNVLDCNDNQILDACEVASGTNTDCNGNGMLDVCETSMGISPDCNGNSIPDGCELSGVNAFEDHFDAPGASSVNWADPQNVRQDWSDYVSPPQSFALTYYQWPIDTKPINLGDANFARVTYSYIYAGYEDSGAGLQLDYWNGSAWGLLAQHDIDPQATEWHLNTIELPPDALNPAFRLRLISNSRWGDWLVDDLLVVTSLADCNGNASPDTCDDPTGDVNGDGLINLSDYQHVPPCVTGPLPSGFVPPGSPCCALLDLNDDGYIDLFDFATLQRTISAE